HIVRHFLVLGREGVDRRRNDYASVVVADLRHVLTASENGGGRVANVGFQKPPTHLGLWVWVVRADVTPPDYDCPKPGQRRREPGSLRIVQHHHVARPDQPTDLGGVRAEHVLVHGTFLISERRAVAV